MKVKAYAILAEKNGELFSVNGRSKYIDPFKEPDKITIYSENNAIINRRRDTMKSSKYKSARKFSGGYVTHQQKGMIKALDRIVYDLGIRYPDYKFFITRLNSAKCPIRVLWRESFEQEKKGLFLSVRKGLAERSPSKHIAKKTQFKFVFR